VSLVEEQADITTRLEAYVGPDRAAGNAGHPQGIAWLGHSNLATTEIYVRADPSEKLEAIEAVVPPHLRKGKFRPPDRLIALLKATS